MAYPDATVLLVERSERGDRGAWVASFVAALTAVAPFFCTRWRSRPARDAYDTCTRMVTPHGEGETVSDLVRPGTYTSESLARCYDRHYAAVRAGVPPGRLAVVRVGSGWAPLSEALRLPVPKDVEYPHEHVSAANVPAISEAAAAAMRPPPGLVVAAVGAAVGTAVAAAVGVLRSTRGGGSGLPMWCPEGQRKFPRTEGS